MPHPPQVNVLTLCLLLVQPRQAFHKLMFMNAIALRRSKKSRRLSLPSHHWSVRSTTMCGLGHLPFTGLHHWGSFSVSLATPVALWPVFQAFGVPGVLLACLASCVLGWLALNHIQAKGTEADHDSSAVVLDEFAGAALAAALAAPLVWRLTGSADVASQILCLLYIGCLFRVFDLIKPWPASVFDLKWHHPFSVMADDLAAGLWAAACAPLPFWLAHQLFS